MKAAPTLERVFNAARYTVDAPQGCITLSIGQANPAMKALMRAHHTHTATILTAFNPGGQPQPELRNRKAQAALETQVRTLGLPIFPGCNLAPLASDAPEHPAALEPDMTEPTVVVLSLSAQTACKLARHYGQLAWVQVSAEGVPELKWAQDRFKLIRF